MEQNDDVKSSSDKCLTISFPLTNFNCSIKTCHVHIHNFNFPYTSSSASWFVIQINNYYKQKTVGTSLFPDAIAKIKFNISVSLCPCGILYSNS